MKANGLMLAEEYKKEETGKLFIWLYFLLEY